MKLNDVINKIKNSDKEIYKRAVGRTGQLIMPPRAMGQVNDISEKLCAISGSLKPETANKAVFVMAGDHGVVAEGVSAFPQEVTGQMIGAFLENMAAINALTDTYGINIYVTDAGSIHEFPDTELSKTSQFFQRKVAKGTKNFAVEPAMSLEEAEKSIMLGFQIASDQITKNNLQVVATGDMGIGNTTPSSAIGAVITGEHVEVMTGRGTGLDDAGLKLKTEVIQKAISKHNPDKANGLDILSKVGGFEIGAIAGVILAASYHQIPVVVDGIISTAGALIAYTLKPESIDYMFAGHKSVEPGHCKMLEYLGLDPILDLNMRLGEGTGAVIAMNILAGAAAIIKNVATFEEAAVSGKSD